MTLIDLLPPQLQPYLPTIAVISCGLSLLLLTTLFMVLLQYSRLRRQLSNSQRTIHQEQRTISELREELGSARIRIAKLSTQLEAERRSSTEKLSLIEDAKKNLSYQFQSLAQQIFEEKSRIFGDQNKERVSALVQPLQEQLQTFQKRIDDIQVNDVRERTSLKEEIAHLRSLNVKITEEAANLTRALRGDKKQQGNWGEMVLERLLERSGLRKGIEYTVQTGFRGRDGKLRKPDVIIRLPEGKDIVVDSKVSLSAWEKYINCETEEEKKRYLREHIVNIRRHVETLSEKNYADLKGVRSLDFVLLFIPIDASFSAACDNDDKLFGDAYERRIIIVTPTTLLATLRTVENLWRFEHQNRNAMEIAERAGAIYDKLRGFLEEMDKIGRQLAACNTTYENAMDKLSRGRGNVISQAGRLTELGVKVKKKIPKKISAGSDEDIAN